MREALQDIHADRATDLAISALVGLCAACWSGLVAGQLGLFRLIPIALIGGATFAATLLWASRQSRECARAHLAPETEADATTPGEPHAPRWPWCVMDGPLVFLVAAVLYLPGYDVTLYGSDATVYFGVGAHLARNGSLAIEDDLIGQTPRLLRPQLSPPYALTPESPLRRSIAGLSFFRGTTGPVYSTFSQLPSVWLAIGFATAGLAGALAMTPLLAAGGVTMFYLFVRRASDAATGLLAAALLATALPQIFYARLPMGEAGGQFFLWGGLLAVSRWHDTRAWPFALAAGAGFGLAALARPEYLIFLPLAVVVGWVLSANGRGRLSPVTVAVALALFAHATLLILFFVPTHYRVAIADVARGGLPRLPGELAARSVLVSAAVAALLAIVWVAIRSAQRTGGSATGTTAPGSARGIARALAGAAIVAWAVLYVHQGSDRSATGLTYLPLHTGWLTAVLAALGFALVARRWWPAPAARLALLIGVVAALHFLYDARTRDMALWSARRLVPVALPFLFVCAATAVTAARRFGRPVWITAAVVAVIVNAMPARQIWGKPFFEGASAGTAQIAELFPPDAVVLIDRGLLPALLDVPLWLMHDIDALQLRESAASRRIARPLVRALPDRPVYAVLQGLLAPPSAPGLTFSPAGNHDVDVLLPGTRPVGSAGVVPYQRLSIAVFRVESAPMGGVLWPASPHTE
jgi:hypothetical protein